MSATATKLNLRPGERRLIVAVGVIVFVVVQWVFIWPKFGSLGTLESQLIRDRATLERYRREIGRTSQYQRRLAELQRAGQSVATAEQALQLQITVQRQAGASGVAILTTDSRNVTSLKPSEFFDEQTLRVSANSGDKELVDLLYKLGSGDSLIRVRDLSISPDPSGSRLNSSIAFVASYQKPAPTRPTRSSVTNAPATTSSSTSTPKRP